MAHFTFRDLPIGRVQSNNASKSPRTAPCWPASAGHARLSWGCFGFSTSSCVCFACRPPPLAICIRAVLVLFKGMGTLGTELLLVSPLLRCSLSKQVSGGHIACSLECGLWCQPTCSPFLCPHLSGQLALILQYPTQVSALESLSWPLQRESPAARACECYMGIVKSHSFDTEQSV